MNLQDKKTVIIVAVIALLLIVGGGWYVAGSKKTAPVQQVAETIDEENVEIIASDDLGIEITVRPDKHAFQIVMTKVEDVEMVDVQYNWIAAGDLPRGGLLNELVPENGKIQTKMIDLGSCSSGRCKYDEGVEEVSFDFKITKKDGKIYAAEKKVTL